MKMLKNVISVPFLFIFSLLFTTVTGQTKEGEKIDASAKVLTDFVAMKEKIPQKLLDVTQGIIIIPKLINAGLGIGGKRGKGIAVIKRDDGTWSDPAFITLTGGSIGFQAGIQSIDLVLIFKDRGTLEKIGNGSFTLGGDASVTAGPVGRNSSASTDYKMEAEIYSYSRSKGLFAGISLSGSALAVDAKSNAAFYGQETDAKTIFSGTSNQSSASVSSLKTTLQNLHQ
jgi:lipid-binding SYLF domain-containing protein